METAHNDREASWNEMLERWTELSWCAHAYHETDMIAAKILLWRDATCEPALFPDRKQESSLLEQQGTSGSQRSVPVTLPDTDHAPHRRSILPEGLHVVQVGGRALWRTLLSVPAAVRRSLR